MFMNNSQALRKQAQWRKYNESLAAQGISPFWAASLQGRNSVKPSGYDLSMEPRHSLTHKGLGWGLIGEEPWIDLDVEQKRTKASIVISKKWKERQERKQAEREAAIKTHSIHTHSNSIIGLLFPVY